VLALRFHKYQLVVPQIRNAVDNRLIKAAPHGGRAGNRKIATTLAGPRLDPHNRLGTVARRGNSRVLVLLASHLMGRNIASVIDRYRGHAIHFLTSAPRNKK